MAKDSSPGDLAAQKLMARFIREAEAAKNGLTAKQLKERIDAINNFMRAHQDLSTGVIENLEFCRAEAGKMLKELK
jgi:BioD-like phosphotransacetylase family protein